MKCSTIQETQQFNTVGGSPKPELISVRRFRADLGIVPSTLWRWVRRGWLDQPIDIGGRKYLSADMVHRFKERAARGEFAGKTKPPRLKPAAQNPSFTDCNSTRTGIGGGEGVETGRGSMPVSSIASGKF